jgi:hypothetical protein
MSFDDNVDDVEKVGHGKHEFGSRWSSQSQPVPPKELYHNNVKPFSTIKVLISLLLVAVGISSVTPDPKRRFFRFRVQNRFHNQDLLIRKSPRGTSPSRRKILCASSLRSVLGTMAIYLFSRTTSTLGIFKKHRSSSSTALRWLYRASRNFLLWIGGRTPSKTISAFVALRKYHRGFNHHP